MKSSKAKGFSSNDFASKVSGRLMASVLRLNRKDTKSLKKYLLSRTETNCWFAIYKLRTAMLDFINLRNKKSDA